MQTLKKTNPAGRRNFQREAGYGEERRSGSFLLLRPKEWTNTLLVGAALALATFHFYYKISYWPGVGMFLLGVVMGHMRYASRYIIPLPHIGLSIALLQYVLAAWITHYYPTGNNLYDIGYRLSDYWLYGTPMVIACMVAWGVGMAKLRPVRKRLIRPVPELLQGLDILIGIGLVGMLLSAGISSPTFKFMFILLANLRYVGLFGRMLCKTRGWKWRLFLVFMVDMIFASGGASFHGLILWVLWTLALWIYIFTPSWRMIGGLVVVGIVMLLPLNDAKWRLRKHIYGDEKTAAVERNLSEVEKLGLWLSFLADSVAKTVSGKLDEDFVGQTAMRYNQGWIVNRVMMCVPEIVPYAEGETIKDAIFSIFVPRVLAPDKLKAGGRENMERFALMDLNEGTSMNLGYAGEMYVNFGYWGGILACGIYSLGFALLFRAACVRAFSAPMWWAVIPYIGFAVLKAEEDFVSVINWTAKSALIIGLVILVFPVIRTALFPGPRIPKEGVRRRKSRADAGRPGAQVNKDAIGHDAWR